MVICCIMQCEGGWFSAGMGRPSGGAPLGMGDGQVQPTFQEESESGRPQTRDFLKIIIFRDMF